MQRIPVGAAVLLILLWAPGGTVHPAERTSPRVPVTYEGDSEGTIARRAQWIEAAKKEGRLVWWGSTSPSEAGRLIAAFNTIYPFIKVDFWRGRGEEIGTKMEGEFAGGRQTVDLALGGEMWNLPRWRKMGVFDPYTAIVPAIDKMDKRLYGKQGDWIQPGNNAITPQYNTRLVAAPEAPKTWEDMLDPKWKGQIMLTSDVKAWVALALGEGGWGIEKTEDFLGRLRRQELLWQGSHSAAHSLLIAGESKLLGEGYWRHVYLSRKRGAPVEWARVSPVAITGNHFFLLKKAPHPHAARLFLEWLYSPRGLAFYEEVTGYGVAFPGSGTIMSRALEGLELVAQTEEVVLEASRLGLHERFARILGATSAQE